MISKLPWKLDEDDPSKIYSADGDIVAQDYTFVNMDDFEAICRLIKYGYDKEIKMCCSCKYVHWDMCGLCCDHPEPASERSVSPFATCKNWVAREGGI